VRNGGDPALREPREDGHGERHVVQGHGDRLPMKVPAAHAPAVREDEWIVRGRVHLDSDHGGRGVQRSAARSEDLWDAPERIRILDLVRPSMRRDDLAAPKEASHVRSDVPDPGLRFQDDESVVVRLRRAAERLERDRRGDLRVLEQPQAVVHRERPDAGHDRGPVDDRQALLRLEDQRRDPGPSQRLPPGEGATSIFGSAFSDEDEPEMGERRQVSAGSEGPAGRDHGMHAAIQEIKQARHEDLSDAGTAQGQRVRAQQD